MTARLYDSPEQFTELVINQLKENRGIRIERQEAEPLLLDIFIQEGASQEKVTISLHETFQTYMASGDINAAIDYMNGIARSLQQIQTHKDNILKIDSAYLFPAIRDERYVRDAVQINSGLSESYLPGLRLIFVETKEGYTKIVNEDTLARNPRLTEEKVRRLSFQNLRAAGWQHPKLELTSPFRPSCTIEVYLDNPHPIECQFLLPELANSHLPISYVIAFSNRQCTLLMRSTEKLETKEQAKRLVKLAKFSEVVKRSFFKMPHPVSQQIFWVNNGQAELLN